MPWLESFHPARHCHTEYREAVRAEGGITTRPSVPLLREGGVGNVRRGLGRLLAVTPVGLTTTAGGGGLESDADDDVAIGALERRRGGHLRGRRDEVRRIEDQCIHSWTAIAVLVLATNQVMHRTRVSLTLQTLCAKRARGLREMRPDLTLSPTRRILYLSSRGVSDLGHSEWKVLEESV